MKQLTALLASLLFATCTILLMPACGTDDDGKDIIAFTVAGTIKTDAGEALAGVMVNSVVDTAYSDAAGRYSVVSHPLGAIEFTKEGFNNLIERVDERDSIHVILQKVADGSPTDFNPRDGGTLPCLSGTPFPLTYIDIKDYGLGTGTMTWSKDKVWVLKNKVFVNDGQILTIEAGTVIKGGSGQASSATALIVARGGKIIANGTPNQPIIFTSESDEIVRDADGNICVQTNLTKNDKGLWGGLVILGKAVLNNTDNGGEALMEGFPATEPRAMYGGNSDDDNSGVLRYVSIRHAGAKVALDNEINALTLGGVGKQTIVEYVETFACSDDGFEIFGGNVNTRYMVSTFHDDDAFDYSLGWRGDNQFWFAYTTIEGDRAGEHDGGVAPITGTPFTVPTIFNATFIGPGTDTGKRAITFRKNAGGKYNNCVIANFAFGVDIEFTGEGQQDCFKNLNSDLLFRYNILTNIGNSPVFALDNKSPLPNNDPVIVAAIETVKDYFNNNGNLYADPELDNAFVPKDGGEAAGPGAIVPASTFLVDADYRGCFEPEEDDRWIDGWTRTADEL